MVEGGVERVGDSVGEARLLALFEEPGHLEFRDEGLGGGFGVVGAHAEWFAVE